MQVCKRHAALQSCFSFPDNAPAYKSIRAEAPAGIEVREAHTDSQVQALLEDIQYRPYDMTQGPLVRAMLIQESATAHTLAVAMHHAICDAVARRVIRHDIFSCYTAALQGVKAELPHREFQEADYSCWEAMQVRSAS